MGVKDFIVTPILLMIIFLFAYYLRDRYTNNLSKKYFFPALYLKILSAIFLGLVYQFYYKGGDTYNYFEQGKVISQAFKDSFLIGLKLLFSNGEFQADTFNYATQIRWYPFPTEFFVVKAAGLLGFLTFNTYSSIAILFSIFSFSGLWAMYGAFNKLYPGFQRNFAIAIFFIPSVFFWGSGLLKDSLMLGALGYLFYSFYNLFVSKKKIFQSIVLILICIYILYTIRVYLLLAFIPPALFWIFLENNQKIKNNAVRKLSIPLFIIFGLFVSFLAVTNISKGDQKYDLDNLAERTKINANYLYKKSVREEGSAYYLGELDGSLGSMLKLAPDAIFVSLFRPFIWEANNILMLLVSIEAILFLGFTLYVLFKNGPLKIFIKIISSPFLLFSLIFTLTLAFAVGVNSFNFGSLARYKIPILPFYLAILFILNRNFSGKKLNFFRVPD